jgi:type IV pilus assembly protein PilY1
MNIDGRLVQGTLVIPTIVPSSTVCSPGGYSWLTFLDYRDGSPTTDSSAEGVDNILVSVIYDTMIVGINVVYIAGEPVVEVATSNNPTPTIEDAGYVKGAPGQFSGTKGVWRKIMQ